MTAPFKDGSYRRPNFGFDGIVPEILQPKPKPKFPAWWELEDIKNWAPPTYPTFPNPAPGPWIPQLPSPPPGRSPFPDPLPIPPTHDVDPPKHSNSLVTENPPGRSEAAPKNWLLSYSDQNGDYQRVPIDSAPAGIGLATGITPAESPGGLLGMLYAMMRQSGPDRDSSLDSDPQDISRQALPERRLVRSTYRA
jgi:hypothetical protein